MWFNLPSPLYEIMRWLTWIVLPATATLISGLNLAWNWELPMEAILSTFTAIETFVGVVLGIAKISNDRETEDPES